MPNDGYIINSNTYINLKRKINPFLREIWLLLIEFMKILYDNEKNLFLNYLEINTYYNIYHYTK